MGRTANFAPMFNVADFQKAIDETARVIEKMKTAKPDEMEELELRRDSAIQTLEIIGGEIGDESLRARAQELIASMNKQLLFTASDAHNGEVRNRAQRQTRAVVDEELFKNAQELKNMARTFSQSLSFDKQVLESVSKRMTQNNEGTGANLKLLMDEETGLSTSTIFLTALVIFVLVYFVIKFL